MIEFKGQLSGSAEKRFWKREKTFVQNLFLIVFLSLAPTVIIYSVKTHHWLALICYSAFLLVIWLLFQIPKSKKEKARMTPKRIFTEDEYIVCVADAYSESRLISDVTKVRDFGEFYELVFPFGKMNFKFICQKDLLTQGTLEEFEALFQDVLEVMPKK